MNLFNMFSRSEKPLELYGSLDHKTMVGGSDVRHVNEMLENAFSSGLAGGENAPLTKIGEYKGKDVFEQQAADQIRISLDGEGKAFVKLIIRHNDPGIGLLALAGGFKDPGESDQQAADREELEEAASYTGKPIETYTIKRHPVSGDVRVWGGPDREDGVTNGSIVAMSTMAMIPVVKDAHLHDVQAGDDATNAGWVPLSNINDANLFGIKGHASMLLEATRLAGLESQMPECFERSLQRRPQDINIGTEDEKHEASKLIQKHTAQRPQSKPSSKLKTPSNGQ